MDWRKWCRLCAAYNEDCLILKSMNEILKDNFSISLLIDSNIPDGLCLECHQFLDKSVDFSKKCSSASAMFKEIVQLFPVLPEDEDLLKIREKHGFDVAGSLDCKPIKLPFESFTFKMEMEDDPLPDNQKKKKKTKKQNSSKVRGSKEKKRKEMPAESDPTEQVEVKMEEEPVVNEQESAEPTSSITSNDDTSNENNIEYVGANEKIISLENLEEIGKRKPTNVERKKINQIFFKYDCHICKEKLTSFMKVSRHCRDVHNVKPKIACICGSLLTCLSGLSRHRDRHLRNNADDQLLCKVCDIKFTRKILLDQHNQDVHGLQSTFQLSCPETDCNKRFATEVTLRQHARTHIKELPDELMKPCPKCDRKFTNSNRLRGHMQTAHAEGKSFICDECGNGFKTKGALVDHQNSHKKDLIYQCDQCPKAFKHLRGIKRHVERHNNTQKVICGICAAELSSKDTLAVHMVIHSTEKKFKCHMCTNAYKRTKNLKIHIMTVHTAAEPQYKCPWCDRSFYDGSNCYKHRKNSHPVEFAATNGKGVMKTYLPTLASLQPKRPDSITDPEYYS